MPEDFLIAVNPEPGSTLPYLQRVPLPGRPVVLKAKETWPRTSKVYCHRAEWPDDVEILERLPVRSACSAVLRSTWSWTGGGRTDRIS